ncbi:MAG: hypothetical protein HOH02_00970 [Oceanospirillaceae bacterium]|jgi:quinol monooxygenase YgiN|nr:hypothetical protein [Oceanospirillaceae bacterium]MBT6076517.1 hypothetical protein [Oceanospirillaceae bacterium]|tara:strand:+ start:531 stop:824 length:294 start_codon:yes stop_codon:yes gene_type:complete
MTCKVIAEWNIKKGLAETFVGAITNGLPNTRKLDGCLKIDFSISEEDPHHCFMTQEWETSQHHKNYVQGLKDSGAWEKLLSLLDNEPTFTYCKLTDI